MSEIVVAIPTFRRPRGLERLLGALAKLETSADVRVLVADNDCVCREGFDVCRRLAASGYRWPLDAIVVAERGIAQVRNALAERALANPSVQFIAMLDDDEWPEPRWLEELLRVQRETGADALQGSILCEYESTPAPWATRCDGIGPIRGETGVTQHLEGAGNMIVSRACFEGLSKPYFDPSFALTGGEDCEFFARLRRQGARFAFVDEAVATTLVPASRTNLAWVLLRSFRTGNSDMRVFLKFNDRRGDALLEFAKIAGAVLLSPLMLVILAFDPNRRVDGLRKLWRACGKIAALTGRTYNEYSVIHGE
jgi:succinoglycan biosynthesis protein ExoM